MDRELVLAGLTITTVGTTLLAAGLWSPPLKPCVSALQWERAAWRALWLPVVPAVVIISVLVGWAIVEPAESDELLPSSVLLVSALFLGLWLRAMLRAGLALKTRAPHVAGTVGLWRVRIVLSGDLIAGLDPDALAAVHAHEAAHVRHRDPLRIWLAQVITDLQWPWRTARRRFDRWRHVLELARDEEARLTGVDGADLAAGILVAARLHSACGHGATLIDNPIGLEERIDRLLAPVPTANVPVTMATSLALFPVSMIGVFSGVRFGEAFVQLIVRSLP